jgi:hypothetical protein
MIAVITGLEGRVLVKIENWMGTVDRMRPNCSFSKKKINDLVEEEPS